MDIGALGCLQLIIYLFGGKMSKKKDENVIGENEKKAVKVITKKQRFGLIISFISLIIIVYVAFLGMSNKPVEHLDNEEALNVLKTIKGSSWLLDDYGHVYPLSIRGETYEKILITNDIDSDNLRLPFYLYFDKDEESLSRQLALIYFDGANLLLKARLPDSKIYDFSYSISKNEKLESITFISEENERTYFIKNSKI